MAPVPRVSTKSLQAVIMDDATGFISTLVTGPSTRSKDVEPEIAPPASVKTSTVPVVSSEPPIRLVITGPKFVPPKKRITATSTIELLLPPHDFHAYQEQLPKPMTSTQVLADGDAGQPVLPSTIAFPSYASSGQITHHPKPTTENATGVLSFINQEDLSNLMNLAKERGTSNPTPNSLSEFHNF